MKNLQPRDSRKPELSPPIKVNEAKNKPTIQSTQAAPHHGPRRLWLGASALALVAGVGVSVWKRQPREAQDEAVSTFFSQSLPIAAGPRRSGEASPMALSSLRGKTLMLNFWATWCPPCIEEMPELSQLADSWQRDFGARVATIGIGIDSITNIQKFYQKLPVSYDLFAANAQGLELIRLLGNPAGGLPFSLIISDQGIILERILGRFEGKKLDIAVRKAASNK